MNGQLLRQGKAKKLRLNTTPVFSREKEELPQVGLEPTMFCVLGRRSTNWPTGMYTYVFRVSCCNSCLCLSTTVFVCLSTTTEYVHSTCIAILDTSADPRPCKQWLHEYITLCVFCHQIPEASHLCYMQCPRFLLTPVQLMSLATVKTASCIEWLCQKGRLPHRQLQLCINLSKVSGSFCYWFLPTLPLTRLSDIHQQACN